MKSSNLRRSGLTIAALVVAVGLLLFGSVGFYKHFHAARGAKSNPPDAEHVVVSNDGEPSEAPIDPNAKYEVERNRPRRIILPSIKTTAFVQAVGKTKTNEVAVPSNVNYTGWYVNGPKPGESGVSLIDGHVSGRNTGGVFKNLSKVKAGDEFSVELGDRTLKKFAVVSVTTYSIKDVNAHLFTPVKGVKKQLNLITCGGTYDKSAKTFDKRILVVSKAI